MCTCMYIYACANACLHTDVLCMQAGTPPNKREGLTQGAEGSDAEPHNKHAHIYIYIYIYIYMHTKLCVYAH